MKKILIFIFTFLGLFFIGIGNFNVSANTSVTYKDWDDATHQLVEKTVEVADDHILQNGFGTLSVKGQEQIYYANQNVSTNSWCVAKGSVTLIIAEGVTVTVNGPMFCEDNYFKICGCGDGSGKLVINASNRFQGIEIDDKCTFTVVNAQLISNGGNGEEGDEFDLEMERDMARNMAEDMANDMAAMEMEWTGETFEQAYNRLFNEYYEEPTMWTISSDGEPAFEGRKLFLYENSYVELNGGAGTTYSYSASALVLNNGVLWVEGGELVCNTAVNPSVATQARSSSLNNLEIDFVYGSITFNSNGGCNYVSTYNTNCIELCSNAKYYLGDSVSSLAESNIEKNKIFNQTANAARITGDKPVYETAISITETSTIDLFKGDTYQISAVTTTPDTATNPGTRKYVSSNGGIIGVNNTGYVTANNVGEATVTIYSWLGYYDCKTTTVSFKVTEKPTSAVTGITLSNEEGFDLIGDEEITLTATITPDEAKTEELKWTASNDNVILEVSSDTYSCKVIGNKAGTATITCSNINKDVSKSVEATVLSDVVTEINLAVESIEVELEDTYTISTTLTPNYLTNKYLTFTSSDETIATVSEDGEITTLKEGTATITIENEDGTVSKTFTITVKSKNITNIVLPTGDIKIKPNGSTKINVTITPSDADVNELVWSSSDESVVKVSEDGTVTAVKIGEATITVKNADGSVSKQIKVIVDSNLCEHTNKEALEDGAYFCRDCDKVITKNNTKMTLKDYIDSLNSTVDPTSCNHENKIKLDDYADYCPECKKVIGNDNQEYELNEYITIINNKATPTPKKSHTGLVVLILILVFIIILLALFGLLYFFSSYKNKNLLNKPFALCDKLFKKDKKKQTNEKTE